MKIRLINTLLLISFLLVAEASDNSDVIYLQDQKQNYRRYGFFRVVNKVTDRRILIKAQSNKSKNYFENLNFELVKCWKSPPDSYQENAAYVVVYERYGSNDQTKVFSGWVFSNNSFLMNIEHRQYDMKLLECSNE